MLLIDDALLSPAKFVLWIFRQVHNAAQQELAEEPGRIRAALVELHRMLEAGQLSEEEFDAREKVLLGRLEEVEAGSGSGNGGVRLL